MRYGRYGLSYNLMRFGLGITFLWIGVDMLRHPEIWIGYMPANVPLGWSRESALQMVGFFDVAVGLGFILRIWPKLVGGLATLHIAGVLIMQGLDAVLIRDVGLLGMALALFFWPARYHRQHHWWQRGFKRKKNDGDE